MSLLVDAMRSVKGFHLDKAAASVLTTCVTLTGNGRLAAIRRIESLRISEQLNHIKSNFEVNIGG